MAFRFDRSFWERFPVTGGLIAANGLLFIVGLLLQRDMDVPPDWGFLPLSGHILILMGGNITFGVREGEIWRLLTACFLHANLIHLLLNMWALATLGAAVEYVYGRGRLLVVYVLTGIAASAASLGGGWRQPWHLSIGASGAICGLLGLLLASAWRARGRTDSAELRVLKSWVLQIVILSLIPGVDMLAHFGGLASGAAAGWFLDRSHGEFPERASRRLLGRGSILLCLAAFAAQAYTFARDQERLEAFDRFQVRIAILEEAEKHLLGRTGEWTRAELLQHLSVEESDPEVRTLFTEARAILAESPGELRPDRKRAGAFVEHATLWAEREMHSFGLTAEGKKER